MAALLKPIISLTNMIVSVINGLIVGTLHFLLNLLDGLFHFVNFFIFISPNYL